MAWTLEEDILLAQCFSTYKTESPEFIYKICQQFLGRTALSCKSRVERIKKTLTATPSHVGFRDRCYDIFRPRRTSQDKTFAYTATQEMIDELIAQRLKNNQIRDTERNSEIDTASCKSKKEESNDIDSFTDEIPVPNTDKQDTDTDKSKTNEGIPESFIDILESNATNVQEFFTSFGEYVKHTFSPKQQKEILLKVCSIATEVELKGLVKNKRMRF